MHVRIRMLTFSRQHNMQIIFLLAVLPMFQPNYFGLLRDNETQAHARHFKLTSNALSHEVHVI